VSDGILRDGSTGDVVFIDHAHHEIHEGDSFFVTDIATGVNNAAPKVYIATTPNTTKYAHILYELWSSAAGLWELYENPTITLAGSAMTEFNHDRNSGTAATVAWTEDATIGAAGTLLMAWRTGGTGLGNTGLAGATTRGDELILKKNEDYLLRFTPDGNGVTCIVYSTWYEHTSRG